MRRKHRIIHVRLKLCARHGVHTLPMKNLIKINPTSFILGAILGGVAIFTIAADSKRPTAWDYRVVEQDVGCVAVAHYTPALANLAKSATNGWEFVSVQIVPDGPKDSPCVPGQVFMVQRRPK